MGVIVAKRWGSEEILFSGPYLVKRLVLIVGPGTSMHYHHCKTETIYVVEGVLEIIFEERGNGVVIGNHAVGGCIPDPRDADRYELKPGDSMTIREGQVNAHRMRCGVGCTKCVYVEASTPHECDSTRLYL